MNNDVIKNKIKTLLLAKPQHCSFSTKNWKKWKKKRSVKMEKSCLHNFENKKMDLELNAVKRFFHFFSETFLSNPKMDIFPLCPKSVHGKKFLKQFFFVFFVF